MLELVLVLTGAGEAAGQLRLAVEGFLGGALNAPSALTIHQDGEPDIELNARYDTRAFTVPVYWSARLSLLDERRAFELQLTHHKLHLSNPSAEVEDFQITHGYNLLTLSYVFRALPVELRGGGGVVFAHPEGTVRGRRFSRAAGPFSGHTLAGPLISAGIGRRFEVLPHVLLTLASDMTASWANGLVVDEGSVDTANFAVHIRFGLGYAF